jgi:hypothetical protein
MTDDDVLLSLATETGISPEMFFAVRVGSVRDFIGRSTAAIQTHLSKSTALASARAPDVRAKCVILRYLEIQLRRADGWLGGPTDLLAYITRSLLDLSFWSKYISENIENANRFLNEREVDLCELNDRASFAYEGEEQTIPTFVLENIISLPRRIRICRDKREDEYVFKLCSKYLHPSSWLLQDTSRLDRITLDRLLLRGYLVLYATRIMSDVDLQL